MLSILQHINNILLRLANVEVIVGAHKTRHEDEGADEISLTGLEGEEITLTPKASSGCGRCGCG